MSLIAFIVATFFSGLIIGALARLALPGRDPMSLLQTALVGIAGSWIAGAIVAIATHGRYTAGLFASFVGAFVIVYIIRRRRGGTLTHPGDVRRGLLR